VYEAFFLFPELFLFTFFLAPTKPINPPKSSVQSSSLWRHLHARTVLYAARSMSSPNVLCHGSLQALEQALAGSDRFLLAQAGSDFVAHALQPLLRGCVRRADPASSILIEHTVHFTLDAGGFMLTRDTEEELATLGLYELVCDVTSSRLYAFECDIKLDQATGSCVHTRACMRDCGRARYR